MPAQSTGLTRHTSTRRRNTTALHGGDLGTPEAQQAQRFQDTLRRAQADSRVLIVTCALPHVERAAQELSRNLGIDTLSLDRLLIDTLHAQTDQIGRSEEHTSELQSLLRISYAVFCLKKKKYNTAYHTT